MRRRDFIAGLGSAAAAWPLAARAQQPALPVVGFVDAGSADAIARYVAASRKGLGETGYVEGQNVTVEHHSLEGQRTGKAGRDRREPRRRAAFGSVNLSEEEPLFSASTFNSARSSVIPQPGGTSSHELQRQSRTSGMSSPCSLI
jgi:hypothetical protein